MATRPGPPHQKKQGCAESSVRHPADTSSCRIPTSHPTGTAPAVTNVAISVATVPAAPISILRFIKTFQIQVGSWTHISDSATF